MVRQIILEGRQTSNPFIGDKELAASAKKTLPGLATAMQQGLLLESSLANRPWANLEQIVIESPVQAFDAEGYDSRRRGRAVDPDATDG